MTVKPFDNLTLAETGTVSGSGEADNLESVVHAGHQQIVFTAGRGMPFYAPRTATDIDLSDGDRKFSLVKQAHGIVIAPHREHIFNVWVTLDGSDTSVKSFIRENWLREALARVPPLEFQIIATGKQNTRIPIIPRSNPRLVVVRVPGICDGEAARRSFARA